MLLQKYTAVSILNVFEIFVACSFICLTTGYCQGTKENVTIVAPGSNEDSSNTPIPVSTVEQLTPEAAESKKVSLATQKATSLLNAANLYLETGNMEAAERFSLKALICAPTESQIYKEAERLFSKVLDKIDKANQQMIRATTLKHKGMLKEANRLADNGNLEAALKIVQEVLTETKDATVLAEAEKVLDRMYPRSWMLFLSKLLPSLWWLLKWLTIGVCIVSIMAILQKLVLLLVKGLSYVASRLSKKWQNQWRIDDIVDNTELGVKELVIASLHQLNAQKKENTYGAGLLRLEGSKFSPSIYFTSPNREVDLVTAIKSLPTIAGVNLQAMAHLFTSVLKWFRFRRPCIGGRAALKNNQLTVRLTSQAADGTIQIVSACSKFESQTDIAATLAEEVSFKMLYLITKGCSAPQSQSAAELRRGLELLDSYVSAGESQKLNEAYEVFANVRRHNPAFDEAYLYEGIALDLLEEHDKAIQHFEFIRQRNKTTELKEKATYNQAISHFRKYDPSELDKAITLLNSLIQNRSHISTPIEAFALAAEANAIAHKPIFWCRIPDELPEAVNEQEFVEQKESRRSQVQDWIKQVTEITSRLNIEEGWDEFALRQARWAVQNALGNVYLNCARSFIGSSDLSQPFSQNDKAEYLKKALSAFQSCEMLLPAGVETLTNMGTVLLELEKPQQAREYLKSAVNLNTSYEYASYRLAQSWELEGNKAEVEKVLKSYNRPVRISGFKKLYEKHQVPLPEMEGT